MPSPMNSTTFLAFLLPMAAMRCAPPCCASSATDLPLGLYVVSAASAGAASAPSVATEARAAIAPVRALCLLMFLLSSMQFRLCRPVSSIRCDRGGFPIRFPDSVSRFRSPVFGYTFQLSATAFAWIFRFHCSRYAPQANAHRTTEERQMNTHRHMMTATYPPHEQGEYGQ